jgi:hypothetical protein
MPGDDLDLAPVALEAAAEPKGGYDEAYYMASHGR